ncbi:hypothetical protein HDU92_005111 [Lobulomyces angularis]|nr:hypothetical protein HDU92_005111 [Lobulomyces angularis]
MDEAFVGGGLKLKGEGGGKIKKKKKEKKKEKEESEKSNESKTGTSSTFRTASELKFLEVQKKRQQAKIEKTASKTHKERVAELNNYLSKLSEHHDIPRVGPG